MKKIIASELALLLFLLSGVTTAFAAENKGETPSVIAYTELEEEIDRYIDVRKDTTSSVSIAYFNETENIASFIYGKANVAEYIEADEETIYGGQFPRSWSGQASCSFMSRGKLTLMKMSEAICQTASYPIFLMMSLLL